MTPKLLLAAFAMTLLASCSSPGRQDLGKAYAATNDEVLPVPSIAEMSTSVRPYIIGPFDRLSIDVFGIDGMQDKEVQADSAGRIAFPLAGSIEAAGLTPNELRESIAQRLRAAHVRDPKVTVNLLEVRSQLVTVEGEVTKAGLYPVIGDMTLLKSLASAQGLKDYAEDSIVVFREVDGKKYAGIYSLKAIRRGNYADPRIYGGDVVVVGESAQKRRFDRVLATIPALLSPIVLLLR